MLAIRVTLEWKGSFLSIKGLWLLSLFHITLIVRLIKKCWEILKMSDVFSGGHPLGKAAPGVAQSRSHPESESFGVGVDRSRPESESNWSHRRLESTGVGATGSRSVLGPETTLHFVYFYRLLPWLRLRTTRILHESDFEPLQIWMILAQYDSGRLLVMLVVPTTSLSPNY